MDSFLTSLCAILHKASALDPPIHEKIVEKIVEKLLVAGLRFLRLVLALLYDAPTCVRVFLVLYFLP